MPTFEDRLRDVLAHIDELRAVYDWKVNEEALYAATGVQIRGQSHLERNLDLKLRLNELRLAGDREQRLAIGRYYVAGWGGVRGNAPATPARHIDSVIDIGVGQDFRGIASWSKVACVAAPHSKAIFDARVVFSMHVIQT